MLVVDGTFCTILTVEILTGGSFLAGYNRFAKLSNGLQYHCFVQCSIDPCIFFGPNCTFLTYVDNCIIVGDMHDQINALIQSLHKGDKNFVLQNEGSIDKYLGLTLDNKMRPLLSLLSLF